MKKENYMFLLLVWSIFNQNEESILEKEIVVNGITIVKEQNKKETKDIILEEKIREELKENRNIFRENMSETILTTSSDFEDCCQFEFSKKCLCYYICFLLCCCIALIIFFENF